MKSTGVRLKRTQCHVSVITGVTNRNRVLSRRVNGIPQGGGLVPLLRLGSCDLGICIRHSLVVLVQRKMGERWPSGQSAKSVRLQSSLQNLALPTRTGRGRPSPNTWLRLPLAPQPLSPLHLQRVAKGGAMDTSPQGNGFLKGNT